MFGIGFCPQWLQRSGITNEVLLAWGVSSGLQGAVKVQYLALSVFVCLSDVSTNNVAELLCLSVCLVGWFIAWFVC